MDLTKSLVCDVCFPRPKTGIELIAAERERQITAEGWTPAHDDEHADGSLSEAADSYIQAAGTQMRGGCGWHVEPQNWPWQSEWWKPSDDPVRNLVKAGALIAAEIDRLSRQNAPVLAQPGKS